MKATKKKNPSRKQHHWQELILCVSKFIRLSRRAGVASALKIYSSTLRLSFWPYMARQRGNK